MLHIYISLYPFKYLDIESLIYKTLEKCWNIRDLILSWGDAQMGVVDDLSDVMAEEVDVQMDVSLVCCVAHHPLYIHLYPDHDGENFLVLYWALH